MLSMNKTVSFIKTTMGFPHVAIEKSDEEISMYIDMFGLNEFSKYVPDKNEIAIDTEDSSNIQDGSMNIYFIKDPEEADVMNVVTVIVPESYMMMHGYPMQTIMGDSYDSLPDVLIAVDKAETNYSFSRGEIMFEYMPPNKVRLFPATYKPGKILVRYERVQPSHLMNIPPEYHTEFLYLMLAITMINCGNIRNKYQNISTPFGDVPLGTDLKSGGEAIRDKIVEYLSQLVPNVMIVVAG